MLAEDMKSYLRVNESDVEAETQQLRSICSTMARLVGHLLQGEERWSRYYWVDAIRASRVRVLDQAELNVEGAMIWGERGQSKEWIEPLSATVRLSEAGEDTLSYQIMCGDAARGLKKEPYSMNPERANKPRVEQWLFTFSERQ